MDDFGRGLPGELLDLVLPIVGGLVASDDPFRSRGLLMARDEADSLVIILTPSRNDDAEGTRRDVHLACIA